ncbi:MAG TPA: serine/threonine-protein kinase, partial [Kofleriaceae bacterium]
MTPDPDIVHGSKIGRFVVVGTLGSGGMGVVYAAHDRELDRHVALKVMRTSAATEEERTRMQREGQAMARVTHPNVITVHEVGVDGAFVFLAEELLDAGTLGSWLEARHSHAEIVEKFELAGRGLAAAHAAGLVHRDFKPDNVLLGKDGRVRVADFGLARALGADNPMVTARMRKPSENDVDAPAPTPMSQLTATGAVMGTPMYMA